MMQTVVTSTNLFRSATTRSSAVSARLLAKRCPPSIPRPRTFFASSTDHTSLVANATVHRVDNANDAEGGTRRDYILVPDGTPLEVVLKVDKLQLARLSSAGNLLFGAKVVQKSLGSPSVVCGSLLDAALDDLSSSSEPVQALASLEGLCEWVASISTPNEKEEHDQVWTNVQNQLGDSDASVTLEACQAIATGIPREGHSVVGMGTFRDAQPGWELLAKEFVNLRLAEEAELYVSKGAGQLDSIEYLANQSTDYMESAGGAMARFTFP
mmetsp:Transcript_3532/g.5427  ORF Transcript_3532/g.5427 Transcript_3532/m.5427 type:complete len:269 (+) Transcript_3532:103-909(+)